MFVLAVVLTVLLLLETLPSAVAGLLRARAGLVRLDQLTRLGLLEGRNLWVPSLLGVVHLAGSAAQRQRSSSPGSPNRANSSGFPNGLIRQS